MRTGATLQDGAREFLAAAGLTHDELTCIWPALAGAYAMRAPPDQTWEGMLRFLLVSQSTILLHIMHGVPWVLRHPQSNDGRHRVLPVLGCAFAMCGVVPARKARGAPPAPWHLWGLPRAP